MRIAALETERTSSGQRMAPRGDPDSPADDALRRNRGRSTMARSCAENVFAQFD